MNASLRLAVACAMLLLLLPSAWADPATLSMDFQGATSVQEDGTRQKASLHRDGLPFHSQPRQRDGAGPMLGVPEIQFEGGVISQREARVLDEPGQTGNRLLEFAVREPNVRLPGTNGMKSRVQMNLYGNKDVAEVYQSVRLRLGPELAALASYPKAFNWFTLSEWWNNAGWTGEPFPFRISVNLGSGGPGRPLHISVHATVMPEGRSDWSRMVWAQDAAALEVPLGRWLVVEYYFREGDAKTGRFVMRVTPDGSKATTVVDVTDYTRHPDNQQPDGLRHFNPIKLYTSAAITEHVRRRGGALVAQWDDLFVLACAAQSGGLQASPCAQRMGVK